MISRQSLAVAAAVLVSLSASTVSAENRTTIQVQAVLASNEGRTFDARLASLKSELKQLRFRSYNLVSSETRVIHGNGGQSGIELPNGRYLHITTREHTPSHVRLHILLNEDNRPVVNTYVKLELGSVVLLGGPRDEEGTLVITLGSRPWRDGDDDLPVQKKPASEAAPAAPSKELPPLAPNAPAQGVTVGAPSQAASR
jgi:hypothetical protein